MCLIIKRYFVRDCLILQGVKKFLKMLQVKTAGISKFIGSYIQLIFSYEPRRPCLYQNFCLVTFLQSKKLIIWHQTNKHSTRKKQISTFWFILAFISIIYCLPSPNVVKNEYLLTFRIFLSVKGLISSLDFEKVTFLESK